MKPTKIGAIILTICIALFCGQSVIASKGMKANELEKYLGEISVGKASQNNSRVAFHRSSYGDDIVEYLRTRNHGGWYISKNVREKISYTILSDDFPSKETETYKLLFDYCYIYLRYELISCTNQSFSKNPVGYEQAIKHARARLDAVWFLVKKLTGVSYGESSECTGTDYQTAQVKRGLQVADSHITKLLSRNSQEGALVESEVSGIAFMVSFKGWYWCSEDRKTLVEALRPIWNNEDMSAETCLALQVFETFHNEKMNYPSKIRVKSNQYNRQMATAQGRARYELLQHLIRKALTSDEMCVQAETSKEFVSLPDSGGFEDLNLIGQ